MNLLQRWLRRSRPAAPLDPRRWVVLDVESSGLDVKADRLLAVGAVAVRTDGARPRIALGDNFEVVLRHDVNVADKANILLHGIGIGAQRGGVAAETALHDFERYIGGSPLLAFHAEFDRALILRACDAAGVARPANPWLDVEPLAALLHPRIEAHTLDEWLVQLGVNCIARHQAAADALATAELLLKLWPAALQAMGGSVDFAAARRLVVQRKWVSH